MAQQIAPQTDEKQSGEIEPSEMSAEELEDHFLEVAGHTQFEKACRAVAKGKPSEKRISLVATREEFQTEAEDGVREIPPQSYLVGEVDFTANFPDPNWLKGQWEDDFAPLVGDADDPMPAIGGMFFGRDSTVFIVPYLTIPIYPE